MTSTFHGIETAKRSLFAQRAALNTTGHNMANAETKGYSRQRVTMQAASSIEAFGMSRSNAAGQLGTGVEVTAIKRVREAYLDEQYRDRTQLNATWTLQSETLSQLEGVINEPSNDGLSAVVQKFLNAWSDLALNPESQSNRTIVAEYAQALTDTFNRTSKQITDIQSDITDNIDTAALSINSVLSSISSLNSQIKKLEGVGDDANDLRDQRDLLTDQLSKEVNINVSETSDGYTITMGTDTLVAGSTASTVTQATLLNAYTGGRLTGGKVHGMFESRDTILAGYLSKLDTVASTLATGAMEVTIPAGSTYQGTTLASDTTVTVNGINGLHQLGFTFDSPTTNGVAFFSTSSSDGSFTAATIGLNSILRDQPSQIVSSLSTKTDSSGVTTAIKGDNALALIIGGLGDVSLTFDQTATGNGSVSTTFNDFYSSMVSAVGIKSENAQRQVKTTDSLVESIDSTRKSVSGVSLDEEASNMIMFQQAYNAAARFMTTMDEVLDKLINGTGRVGL